MGKELVHQRISKAGKVTKGSCRCLLRWLDLRYCRWEFSSAQLASFSLALSVPCISFLVPIANIASPFIQSRARAPVVWTFSRGLAEASGADPESLTSTCYRRYGWKKSMDPMRKAKTCSAPGKANARLCFRLLRPCKIQDAGPSCCPTCLRGTPKRPEC